MYEFAYQKPGSLADAVKLLSSDSDAKALAGGMTYIPVLKQRLVEPSTVVDLSGDEPSVIRAGAGDPAPFQA